MGCLDFHNVTCVVFNKLNCGWSLIMQDSFLLALSGRTFGHSNHARFGSVLDMCAFVASRIRSGTSVFKSSLPVGWISTMILVFLKKKSFLLKINWFFLFLCDAVHQSQPDQISTCVKVWTQVVENRNSSDQCVSELKTFVWSLEQRPNSKTLPWVLQCRHARYFFEVSDPKDPGSAQGLLLLLGTKLSF